MYVKLSQPTERPTDKQMDKYTPHTIRFCHKESILDGLICIMKSNSNAFYVNSRRITYDCQFIIEDPNEIKTHFFATASQISHMSRFIRRLILKKSLLVFFYSRKSKTLIEFLMFNLIRKF